MATRIRDKLPKDVEIVRQALLRDPSHEFSKIAKKLIANTPDLVAMWQTLERQASGDDELWVWGFLGLASKASSMPVYHHMPARKRRELSAKISRLATELASTLDVNELDVHLTCIKGINFHGFYFFEDFGLSNQEGIKAAGDPKLKATTAITRIAARAAQQIADEPIKGKSGTNAAAIRFVRWIAARNQRHYGRPLNQATAIATNAIYGTSYEESDIRKLLSR
jgi:hypothetical protein